MSTTAIAIFRQNAKNDDEIFDLGLCLIHRNLFLWFDHTTHRLKLCRMNELWRRQIPIVSSVGPGRTGAVAIVQGRLDLYRGIGRRFVRTRCGVAVEAAAVLVMSPS